MRVPNQKNGRRERHGGQTLLELVVATALMAVALIPALRLLRDSVQLNDRVETQSLLTILCVSKLEEHLGLGAASWTMTTESGNFASDGYAGVRYQVSRSDDVADGGIADRLMTIEVTTWDDSNGDGVAASDETQITFRSKIAKTISYQNEAGTP